MDAGHGAARGRFDVAFGAGDLTGEIERRASRAGAGARRAARGESMNVLRCITPRRSHSALAQARAACRRPLAARATSSAFENRRDCRPCLRAFSLRSCTTAYGVAPGARIAQTDGLERPEAQRVLAAIGHLFDRQAALEVRRRARLRSPWADGASSVRRSRTSCSVLLAVERNVEIVVAVALVVARLAVHLRFVDRIGRDDRRGRVVVVQARPPPAEAKQPRRCSRATPGPAAGRRRRRTGRSRGICATSSRCSAMRGSRGDARFDGRREALAVDGERAAGGNRRFARAPNDRPNRGARVLP